MRKNIIYLLTCLVTMAVSAGLVSCSSDDDRMDSPITKEIIGTWYASDNSVNRECTVTFYSDGTGELYSEYHGKYGSSDTEMTGEFTWSCSGNTIKTYGTYVYIDYNTGSIDSDYDPEVIYYYDGSTLTGGRYSGAASIYRKR